MGIHKWKYVFREHKAHFLGEMLTEKREAFRICERCGKVQEYFPTYYTDWFDLGKEESRILKKKVADKGEYYLLGEQNA
jgi:hypothetical protein